MIKFYHIHRLIYGSFEIDEHGKRLCEDDYSDLKTNNYKEIHYEQDV